MYVAPINNSMIPIHPLKLIFGCSIKVSAEILLMLVIRRYCIGLEEFQLSILQPPC